MVTSGGQLAMVWTLVTLQLVGLALVPVGLICRESDGSSHVEMIWNGCDPDGPIAEGPAAADDRHGETLGSSDSCGESSCVDAALDRCVAIRGSCERLPEIVWFPAAPDRSIDPGRVMLARPPGTLLFAGGGSARGIDLVHRFVVLIV